MSDSGLSDSGDRPGGSIRTFLSFSHIQHLIAELFISPSVLVERDMQRIMERVMKSSLPEQQALYDTLLGCFDALGTRNSEFLLSGSLDEKLEEIERQFALRDGNGYLRTGYLRYRNRAHQQELLRELRSLLQCHYTVDFKAQFQALSETEKRMLFEKFSSFQQQLQQSPQRLQSTLSEDIHRVIPLEGTNWEYLIIDDLARLDEESLVNLIVFMGIVLGKY